MTTAQSWRRTTPSECTRWFSALAAPWWIAGGWAMDLFLGSQTRQHNDLDIGVLRRDAMSIVSMLADWEIFEAKGGLLRQLQPRQPPRADVNSLWCRPEGASDWVLELM